MHVTSRDARARGDLPLFFVFASYICVDGVSVYRMCVSGRDVETAGETWCELSRLFVLYYYTLFLTDPRVLVPIRLQITQNVKSE